MVLQSLEFAWGCGEMIKKEVWDVPMGSEVSIFHGICPPPPSATCFKGEEHW